MELVKQTKLVGSRNEKGLSQKEMSRLLGISITSYRNKELGNVDFKLEEVKKICKKFNKKQEEIFL